MEHPERRAVMDANLAFYRAFESLQLEEMGKVWARGVAVRCVHPGWPLLRGWDDVMASWERIFENASMMKFAITGAEAEVEDDWAWVACMENIMSVQDGRVGEGKVQATNIFRKIEGRWLVVHHHGSPVG